MQANTVTDSRVHEISKRVVRAAKDAAGDKLYKVILFGSYARGDYDSESDIDFLIISDLPQEEACSLRKKVRERLADIDLEFDLLISCCYTGKAIFEQFADILPFYANVLREGVVLHG